MIRRGLLALGPALALFFWLRATPAERLAGTWAVDEAAWAAADPDLRSLGPAEREAVLESPRRSPLFVRFDPHGALTISLRGEVREGRYRVATVEGDTVVLDARMPSGSQQVERRLVAQVGWGRCVLDVGLGRPLPFVRLR